MNLWQKFKTFKQRGEWVELLFMAAAELHGYHVLKPWGDCLEYDVGVEQQGALLRVQVKSSSARNGTGYLCQFRRNYLVADPYTLDQVDLFAMYVIPAAVILKPTRKLAVMLCPVTARNPSPCCAGLSQSVYIWVPHVSLLRRGAFARTTTAPAAKRQKNTAQSASPGSDKEKSEPARRGERKRAEDERAGPWKSGPSTCMQN